ESRVDDLKDIVFHAKLGTQLERVQRIAALAGDIAKIIGADVEKAKRAARLCKADLTTGVVGEFPELQGVMGRYYALHDGEAPEVADAIRDHYKPLGPSDAVPTAPVSIAVALADKLDTLVGFFAIDEKPTGSGDPYALRRSALGLLRIMQTNQMRFELRSNDLLFGHLKRFPAFIDVDYVTAADLLDDITFVFLRDRLEVLLRDRGISVGIVRAVFGRTLSGFNPVELITDVSALQAFLKTDDGANLLTGYRRAANILRIEEKKDKREYRGVPDGLRQEEEKELQASLVRAKVETAKALTAEDFAGAMTALAALRVPVDRFFDKVTVNTDDKVLRENRLMLLSQIVETAHQVADFSKVEG
ncbi:MAG TPA: glycine--tRNA ligase subunit beta, partial [Micropepsaceae bacterium]|nr:glycine--tRNA ligase subunit beta [Micropepsaceae bacterium]